MSHTMNCRTLFHQEIPICWRYYYCRSGSFGNIGGDLQRVPQSMEAMAEFTTRVPIILFILTVIFILVIGNTELGTRVDW